MSERLLQAGPGVSWLVPDWPAPDRVQAASTLRQGGESAPPYAGLNLATHVGDEFETVDRNRRLLSETLHLPAEPVWLEQVHGRGVVAAHTVPDGESPAADASWTNQAAVVCGVMTADCLPVLFCDRQGSCIAAAHAGWRGLHAGVLEATVAEMAAEPGDILVWLGPAIGPQQFQVGAEVRDAFIQYDAAHARAFEHQHEDKWLADIYRLARQRLQSVGVTAIYGGGLCTYTDQNRFFSYRRESTTGRMASLIYLCS